MRAAVVPRHGPPDVIEIRDDWPEPDSPGEGEVHVAVEVAGLNPSDTKIRAGGGPSAAGAPGLPYVAGREAAGTIIGCGPGVDGFGAGDPVFSFFGWNVRPGGHAERLVVPASMVARRPPAVQVTEAAGVPLAGLTALQALGLLDPPSGARLVVTAGSGGVGHFAVQLAALRALEVVATTGPTNQEFVRGLGASDVIDYHERDAVSRLQGASYVLDAVGGDNIALYQDVLADGAHVVAVAGLPSRLRPGLQARAMRARPSGEDLARLAGLLAAGQLITTVEEVFALERVADAHRLLEQGHVRGKLVIRIG